MKTNEVSLYKCSTKEAKAQICLTLKDEPLNGVLHKATSKEVWKTLYGHYKGKGKQTQAYLI